MSIFNSLITSKTIAPALFAGLLSLMMPSTLMAQEKIDLEVHFPKGVQHRVDMQLEHKGDIIVNGAGQDEKFRKLKMNTVAKLGYYQRYTGRTGDNQAVRYYDKSKGEFRISKGVASAELGDRNRLVVSRVESKPGKRIQMASALSTLSQAELELLKNPADPLSLATLLKKKDLEIGQKWTPDENGLANFLALDRIIQNDTVMYIKDIREGVARVFLTGEIRAAIDDVTTEMEVNSIIKVHLKNKMVTKARLGIREVRQPGQLAPGYDGHTIVDLAVVADKSCPHLTNESLTKYTKSRVIEQRLKWESAKGMFQLKYDPRWRVIIGEQEAAILRFLSNGTLLAQCNVVQLPARPANKPLTMKEYKTEIAKIVATDPKARIVGSDEFRTKENSAALRIEVDGEEDGVPVSWYYYHVSNDDGRCVTLVFTLEKQAGEIFKPADKTLVNAFKFFPRPAGKAKSGRSANSKASSTNKSARR